MTNKDMLQAVQEQLAIDMNCKIGDLSSGPGSIVFTEARENPGRRPFPRGEEHFEMLTMGAAVVVSASPRLLEIIKPQLEGASRDEAFSMPFVYGHGQFYLPDLAHIKPLVPPAGYEYDLAEQREILDLYKLEGFHYALGPGAGGPRPDVLAMFAVSDGIIIGMAGASEDCATMWQIGINVHDGHRRRGLAAYLVNRLTLEILGRGRIPYYGTSSSNIASQRVAHRAGYTPAWACAYRGRFGGVETSPTS